MDQQTRRKSSFRRHQLVFAAVVLIPAALWLLAMRYGPILFLGYLSTQNWQALSAGRASFVGLAHYQEALLADELFRTALGNTIHYTLLYLVIQFPLALGIALWIDSLKREAFRQAALTAYFLPLITSMTATAVIFVFLYNPVNGLFNHILRGLGFSTVSFLRSPETALNSVVLVNIWKSIGFPIVIFYAGLQTIPVEYYDAASIDGANGWQRFRFITWPLLKPTTMLLLIIQLIETMKVFTPVFVMTGTGSRQPGGPLYSTLVWSLHIFNQAFRFNRLGYGAALSILMFTLVIILLAIQLRLTRTQWK
jgi:ABC-type sugar transport system permease subunit